MNIGLKIKELREKKNLTQEEFSEKLGISKQMVSLYETGINEPRKAKLIKIAEILGVDISYFYTNLTEPSQKKPDTSDQAEVETLKKEVERLRTLVIDLTEELRNKKK